MSQELIIALSCGLLLSIINFIFIKFTTNKSIFFTDLDYKVNVKQRYLEIFK